MKQVKLLILFFLLISGSSCLFTKLVTVPMRVGGAIISIVPVAGNSADKAIDEAADVIDEIPI